MKYCSSLPRLLARVWPLLLCCMLFPSTANAQAAAADVQTAWRLLDYIAVDYGGAVENGRIKSQSEYAEMTEFAGSVSSRLATLPLQPERAALLNGAGRLQGAIAAKAAPAAVATLAHGLAADLLRTYPVPLAPAAPPSFSHGTALFGSTCAACHGATGDGHGPNAATLSTPPIAFTDAARARERSIFAPVPSDQSGDRRHGDAELWRSAVRRSLGVGIPRRQLRRDRWAST